MYFKERCDCCRVQRLGLLRAFMTRRKGSWGQVSYNRVTVTVTSSSHSVTCPHILALRHFSVTIMKWDCSSPKPSQDSVPLSPSTTVVVELGSKLALVACH